jgi:hypothetical protein
VSTHVLDALDRILSEDGEPDDVLRAAVSELVSEPGIVWAGVAFLEDESWVLGPNTGKPDTSKRIATPIEFQGSRVGELWVDGVADLTFLGRVAALLSAHVLIGWDTRGEGWEP